MSREPFSRYRELLAAAGFRPSRRLGQNFLLDPSLHRVIAEAAAPGPEDLVLEVGVGLGFLTRELLARAGLVIGVEIDARLLEVARTELAGGRPRGTERLLLLALDILGEDGEVRAALREVLARESARLAGGRFLLVANLPYAVSGPFLAAVTTLDRLPDRIVVLVQRELAERIAAAPGGSGYGSLSALLQTLYRPRVLRRVGPEVFRPRPKVDSALLLLEPVGREGRNDDRDPLGEVAARRGYRAFLRALFAQRRKTLRSNLPRALAELGLPGRQPGIDPDLLARRPEALPPAALLALWVCAGGGSRES